MARRASAKLTMPDMPDPKSSVPPLHSTPSSTATCLAHASLVGLPHRLYTKPSSSVNADSFLSCINFSAFASAKVKYHQPPLPFTNKNVLYVLSLRRNRYNPQIPPPSRPHSSPKPWPSFPPAAFATTLSTHLPPSFVSIILAAFPTVPIAQRFIKYAQIHLFRADQTEIAATLRKSNKQNK